MAEIKQLEGPLAVTGQLEVADVARLAAEGVRALLCVRPDDEEGPYSSSEDMAREAAAHGLAWYYAPIRGTEITEEAIAALQRAEADLSVEDSPSALPALVAYCRSGRRVVLTWALARVLAGRSIDEVLAQALAAGHDIAAFRPALEAAAASTTQVEAVPAEPEKAELAFDVVVVGGGSAGLATAASLLRRRRSLTIGIIEPSAEHHYQPGLTLVGTGHFDPRDITRHEASVIPEGAEWVQAAAAGFAPEAKQVLLADGRRVAYRALVVAPGLTLDWDGIEGARDALGSNGVCCNYSPQHAPYTWEQVRKLRGGTALFTQPPMPIKCAGAPQKALYLSCDRWLKAGVLGDIDVQFHNSGAVLFGVAHFVPTLMRYIERYHASLHFGSTLVAIDGPGRVARFHDKDEDGSVRERQVKFDLLHFVPPQKAPDFVAKSPLAAESGWLEVDPTTLQHPRFPEVFGVGDVISASNAKTMAAARKHAPVVAENLIAQLEGRDLVMGYDGYGACPLTVEAGKVVLAEFGYGGKLLPTFPLEPAVPRFSQWVLKRYLMPVIYWDMMLKGREWYAGPQPVAEMAH
ncbi:MAG: TIGR01244 family sulfur transferase [Pseudomonadales bacterium]|jgi:sulfide:quinone oxidoreductase|nr:TIGR01244 family sulfur transferase [Pseudomonadales bacterium]